MRLLFVAALAASLAACASPETIRAKARAHDAKAAELEARGYYHAAAKERAAAQKQREKAAHRASYLYYY